MRYETEAWGADLLPYAGSIERRLTLVYLLGEVGKSLQKVDRLVAARQLLSVLDAMRPSRLFHRQRGTMLSSGQRRNHGNLGNTCSHLGYTINVGLVGVLALAKHSRRHHLVLVVVLEQPRGAMIDCRFLVLRCFDPFLLGLECTRYGLCDGRSVCIFTFGQNQVVVKWRGLLEASRATDLIYDKGVVVR